MIERKGWISKALQALSSYFQMVFFSPRHQLSFIVLVCFPTQKINNLNANASCFSWCFVGQKKQHKRSFKSSDLQELMITTRSGILFSVTHRGNILLTRDESQSCGRTQSCSNGPPERRRVWWEERRQQTVSWGVTRSHGSAALRGDEHQLWKGWWMVQENLTGLRCERCNSPSCSLGFGS